MRNENLIMSVISHGRKKQLSGIRMTRDIYICDVAKAVDSTKKTVVRLCSVFKKLVM